MRHVRMFECFSSVFLYSTGRILRKQAVRKAGWDWHENEKLWSRSTEVSVERPHSQKKESSLDQLSSFLLGVGYCIPEGIIYRIFFPERGDQRVKLLGKYSVVVDSIHGTGMIYVAARLHVYKSHTNASYISYQLEYARREMPNILLSGMRVHRDTRQIKNSFFLLSECTQ